MNVHVFSEQLEDPAIKLLARVAEIIPLSLEEVRISEKITLPFIVLSSVLPVYPEKFRHFCQVIYYSQSPALFVPPWKVDMDISTILDAPAHIVVGKEPSIQIEIVDNELREIFGKDNARIRCDHHFVTPLQTGVMAENKAGRPIIIRYRPNNIATPIYMTTIQLLSHSSRSDSLDRAKLLSSLLFFLSQQQSKPSEQTSKEAPELTPQDLRSVVLAITQVNTITPSSIQELLSDRLHISLSHEKIQISMDELTESGVLIPADEGIIINQTTLDRWITDLDLRAYVRELNREIE